MKKKVLAKSTRAIWTNKKYAKRECVGYYSELAGERVFTLSAKTKNGNHHVTFESWQMAKSMGWKHCKVKKSKALGERR